MAVRSKLLASGVMTAAAVTAYTCPAGKTAIVKEIRYFNPTTGAITTPFFAQVIGGASRGWIRDVNLGIGLFSYWNFLYLVLMPGQTITVQTNPLSAVQYTIHGVELDGVAP